MDFERRQLMQALTTLAIEKVLLNMGKPVFEKITNKLRKEYKCYIPDCYDHPEFLEEVLKCVFGNSSRAIMESIVEELADYTYDQGVRTVISTIAK
jgi:hypothetical protein